MFENEAALELDSNPLHWSVRQVVDFLMTTDCASMSKLIVEQVRIRVDLRACLVYDALCIKKIVDLESIDISFNKSTSVLVVR